MPNLDPSIARELLAHQTFLRRLSRDLVGEDADDLVQEVWQRALERPPRHGRELRGWLGRIARNLAANRWSGEARRREREERRALEEPAGQVEARFELRKELVEALDALGQPYREAILLRYFEDLAPGEIARRQGTPVGTVKTRLRRGLAQLRETLDQRHGGERARWMGAVAALGAPAGRDGAIGTLVIEGVTMGTTTKVSAAALAAAVCVYLVVRAPRSESPQMATIEPPASDAEVVQAARAAEFANAAEGAEPDSARSLVAEEPAIDAGAAAPGNVLRVVLEGLEAEDARIATVTLSGVHERDGWPMELEGPWPCRGLSTEFDLDPVFASVEQHGNLRAGELEVAVAHPHRLGARSRISLDGDGERTNGRTVHEVRVRLIRPDFWPELTLSVRDANTRAHLEHVELRIRSGPGLAVWGRNNPSRLLGEGLRSPVALMGGREPDASAPTVAGVALAPAAGESPRLVELTRRGPPEGGVIVSARAPGYAWASTSVDVSQGDRELLLEPAAALDVRLANVERERYAALATVPMLCVHLLWPDGVIQNVHFEPLDEALAADGLRLPNLLPGAYRVAVELRGGAWAEQPVLALEEFPLTAGETRRLVLTLAEAPAPPQHATLGGVVSFPAPAGLGAERVRLQLFFQPTQRWRDPDVELALGELERTAGALPTWSFRVEDLPVGRYRVQLMPFLKVWMIDLPAGGREDLRLVLPELAEVLLETVDGQTGARVARDELYYRFREPVPGQRERDLARAETEEPGRFRFWAVPGAVRVWPKFPNGAEREFGGNGMDLELVPGRQSVKFELAPAYAMRFEFRADGTTLPVGPQGLHTTRDIRAVDHAGRVTNGGLQRNMRVEVSAPGVYEIRFDGVTGDRYHSLPPRLVDVRAGETTEVVVELRSK
ncbi:MAG: RNA polymerase sigma factor [Planctomycetota bacterium]